MGLFSGITHAIGGVAKIITGNQTKQKNKGLIGQAYRENVEQQGLQQANTRQSANESLNARGVFSAGANPGPIGTALQQVAKSGGQKIAGSGVDPFLTAAGQGATGAANTLSGGANQQMTDQFAYEDLGLARGKSQAEQANMDQYKATIGGAISDTAKAFGLDDGGLPSALAGGGQLNPAGQAALNSSMSTYAGTNAAANRASVAPMTGAYGMPTNPTFFGGSPSASSSQGTVIGDGSQPNYGFH